MSASTMVILSEAKQSETGCRAPLRGTVTGAQTPSVGQPPLLRL